MCKSLDVAVSLLDKSIEIYKKNHEQKWLMDYVKVHKLLYLGQCYIRYHHNMDLFEEKVSAHNCGPYVDGLDLLVAKCGFSAIKDVPGDLREYVVPLPLSFTRREVLDYIFENYGHYSVKEIVQITKNTSAYQKHIKHLDNHEEMPKGDLKIVGKELFASTRLVVDSNE